MNLYGAKGHGVTSKAREGNLGVQKTTGTFKVKEDRGKDGQKRGKNRGRGVERKLLIGRYTALRRNKEGEKSRVTRDS